jgi:branched-chain amino acid transport system permease protein
LADRRLLALAAVVLAGAIALPFLTNDNETLTIAVFTFAVASLATSWNIIGGMAGQISLGHAAFFGMGALVTRELWLGGRSLALSLAVAVVITVVVALVIGVPILRLRGIYFAIGTLAVAEAIRLTVGNVRPGISFLSGDALQTYAFGGRYFLALGILLTSVAVAVWLTRSKLGLGMLALREDEEAARATGINVFAHKLTAFAISAGLAALAGGALAFFSVSVYPSFWFSPEWTFDALLVAFIGGVGTLSGPLIGSVFFVLIRNLLAANLVEFHVIIFGTLFILVVLLLPGGMVEGGRRLLNLASRSGAPTTLKEEEA